MTTFASSYNSTKVLDVNVTSDEQSDSFDQLLPTLIECFLIVLCGYVACHFKFIPKEHSKGMNYFTANLAMPAMIFLNLASLDFRDVNWTFFAAILTSKSLIFLFVVVLTAMVHRPVNLSMAAIYAIFVTHVNDFGLGYPIFQSLYAKQNPMYPGYIYLIGQISLVVLNPVAFVLMELEKARNQKKEKTREWWKIAAKVTWKIASNPNVWMTVLAIIANITFYDHMPRILQNVLYSFSSAFQSLVLFLLGICAVGAGKTKNNQLLVICLLLVTKILVTPLTTRATVQLFCSLAPDKKTLADYGFLYGTIPTAPVVLLYAVEFGLPTDMLAAALVMCTLISGPVMYIATRMITVQIFTILQYMEQLRTTLFYISNISIFSNIWVGLLFVLNGRWKKPPYSVVGALLISQAIMSVGSVSWSLAENAANWSGYLQIVSITGGLLSARFWTALLAITIMILHRHAEAKLSFMKYYYVLFGFGIPAAIVVGLMLINGFQTEPPTIHYQVPSFLYGINQAYASLVVLTFCLVTIVSCLVMYSRDKQLQQSPVANLRELVVRRLSIIKEGTSSVDLGKPGLHQKAMSIISKENNIKEDATKVPSVSRGKEQRKVTISEPEPNKWREELKPLSHVVLLLLQCVSMIVALIVTIWRLLADHHSGIYVALEFLDVVLTFGQGFYCLAVYGNNTDVIVTPLMKIWNKTLLRIRGNKFQLPEDLDEKTFSICTQFLIYHYNDFEGNIPQNQISKKYKYRKTFLGSELVEWLMKEGVAKKREEAVAYMRCLSSGKILLADRKNSGFEDGPSIYYFNPTINNR